jgi:hypothetical protein
MQESQLTRALLLDLVYDEIAMRDFLSEDDEILQVLFNKLHKISF